MSSQYEREPGIYSDTSTPGAAIAAFIVGAAFAWLAVFAVAVAVGWVS